MNEWQPIETAPKVGVVLVYGGTWDSEDSFVEAWPCSVPWHVCHYGFENVWILEDAGGKEVYINEPTHWMPLPEPPTGN